MDRHHVWLVEPGRGLGLPAEPLLKHRIVGEIRGQQLHRDHALRGGVVGPPHLAHAAAAQQLDQPVASERRPVHIGLLTAAVQQTISAPTRPDDEIEQSHLSNGVRNDNVTADPQLIGSGDVWKPGHARTANWQSPGLAHFAALYAWWLSARS